MGNKVSPVVSGIIIAVVVVVAVFFGYRATTGSGERVTTPQNMGQMMGGDNKTAAPPTRPSGAGGYRP